MLFPPPSRIGPSWRTLDLPMLASTTNLVAPWDEVARDVLRTEGISLKNLELPGIRRPTFGEAWRPFVVAAERFETGPPEPDESASAGARLRRTIGFDLPRGAYATVVLRALSAVPATAIPA
jgi:tRNA(Glu) U13 pseudouridine synthase TruD